MAEFVEGDTGSILLVECYQKHTDTPYNWGAGIYVVQLIWKDVNGALVTKNMAQLTPHAEGKAQYQFQAGELYAPVMTFEVLITESGRVIGSNNTIREVVRKRLSAS